MNRSQFIAAIAEDLGTSKEHAKEVVESFQNVVTTTISSGEPVTLSGFVKFARKDTPAKPARDGRNPATGETIRLKPKPASVAVKVTPLKALKDTVIEAAAKQARKAKRDSGKKKKAKKGGKR